MVKTKKKQRKIIEKKIYIHKERIKYVRYLIAFILLAIMINFGLFYLYFQQEKTENKPVIRCEDDTPYNTCSKVKPFYCYEGQLLKKAITCGCPEGYRIDFQDCKKIS